MRDWDDEDERRFYEVMNRARGDAPSRRRADARRNGARPISVSAAYQRDFGHTFWIVEDRASGDILGFCGLKRVNSPGAGRADRRAMRSAGGCGPKRWGQGIAKEAAIASLDLAFGRFGAPHVIALTVPGNRAS